MLSRNLKRALLDSRWPLPPTFLLPWAANITTASSPMASENFPPPPHSSRERPPRQLRPRNDEQSATPIVPSQFRPESEAALAPSRAQSSPPALSSSVRQLLPILKSQSPHYITIHIHGKPYLLTQGDTIRLPFLMHGVEPGDVLRFNRAVNIGSREYTLKAAAATPKLKSSTMGRIPVIEPIKGPMASDTMATTEHSATVGEGADLVPAVQANATNVPHFIPHLERGKHSYLDERLYVCRAVVMGVETEPLRIKEKTKRRQRKVKRVKSKHRFTILRVKEITVKSLKEIEGMGSNSKLD